MECENEEQLTHLKNKAIKVKIIALEKMEKHPLSNPSYFSKNDRSKVLELMLELFSKDDEEINNLFNVIVNEKILANGLDYQNYPVYDLSKKDLGDSENLSIN